MKSKLKVIVGMSGGTDSTVAAALLKKRGYEVVGLTLSLWDDASRCCNYNDIMDAKIAAKKLNIRHYTINAKAGFKKDVVDYFADEYLSGKTPNPCVICNDRIKFKYLIQKMKELDFDKVATGHYCKKGKLRGRDVLKKGKDDFKSQEYFLAGLEQEMLKYVIFPLGNYEKKRVKELARELGFKAGKKESQEVCFLKDNESPYDFINRYRGIKPGKGSELRSKDGKHLKSLEAAYYKYTVGQRKGLGYSSKDPMYVTAINAPANEVILGQKEDLYQTEFRTGRIRMYVDKGEKFSADVKIRYLQKAAKAHILMEKNGAKVIFDEKQFAITPGQLAVFYEKNVVIGSGFIL